MNVRLDKTVALPCTPEAAWAFLQDIESVATCLPGARITERVDDQRYKGTVTVKVGPATLSFRGDVAVQDVDAAARSLRLVGKGTDSTGSSGASMNLVARVDEAPGGGSTLTGTSDVSMSGKAAAFGGRMVQGVAEQILKQFADNVAARVATLPPPEAPAEADAPQAAVAPAAPMAPDPPGATDRPPAIAAPRAAPATPPPPAAAAQLNGLALVWAAFKDWVRGLFGKNPA
jgi:carbon monoxide dehydrogenase subunit G